VECSSCSFSSLIGELVSVHRLITEHIILCIYVS
jgi:hypothetical protein